MDFEWDEDKRRTNLEKHGVDLLEAALIFDGDYTSRVDDRRDYGEQRLVSIGLANGKYFVVVHTLRGETIRLISAWRGGRDERKIHETRFPRGHQGDAGKGRTDH